MKFSLNMQETLSIHYQAHSSMLDCVNSIRSTFTHYTILSPMSDMAKISMGRLAPYGCLLPVCFLPTFKQRNSKTTKHFGMLTY